MAAQSERTGNVKATRDDWIRAAQTKLESVAVDELKILNLAEDLNVSRSSFYWYFDDLAELREELLVIWGRSTAAIVDRAKRPATNIITACLGVFECWSDTDLVDPPLDFAIRDWGRRDGAIAERVYLADIERLEAVSEMFRRYGFTEADSTVRARLLYHSQLGYYAVGTNEAPDVRLMFLPSYLVALTNVEPTPEELNDFTEYFRSVQNR